MIDKPPPERAPEPSKEPGKRGTYGQHDFVESAQRSRLHKDQHFGPGPSPVEGVPDPYGEGGFAGGGDGRSGYGGAYGQLEGSQRHEKAATERDYGSGGTPSKSSR